MKGGFMKPQSLLRLRTIAQLIAALCLWMLAAAPAAAQSNTVTLALAAEPSVIVVNEPATTITASLTGDASACPVVGNTPPMDAIILLDTPSLDAASLSDIQAALDGFLGQMKLSITPANGGDQLGVITLNGDAPESIAMTQNASVIRSAIENASAGGSLTLSQGLQAAVNTDLSAGSIGLLIDPVTQNTLADRAIVVLSGRTDDPDISRWIDLARAAGARVISVAIGTGATSPLLSDIAASPADYISTSDISAALSQAGQRLQLRTAATDILMTLRYDGASLNIDPASLIPPGALDTASSTITWRRGRITGGETATFSFNAQVRNTASFTAVALADGTYLACGGSQTPVPTPARTPLNSASLTLQGVSATATPSPTASVTPIAATAVPTEDTSPRFLADDAPTAVPANQATTNLPGLGLSLCADNGWNIILLVIAIVLFIIWLYFFLKWLGEYRSAKRSLPCLLGWSTFLAYLMFFIFLLLLPLMASACEVREIVYFWRQDSSTGLTGIYQSVPNQRAAIPVTTLNQVGCVGCHSTAPGGSVIAVIEGAPPGPVNAIRPDGGGIVMPTDSRGAPISAMYIAFSPDGKHAVIADSNTDLLIWDTTTGITNPLIGASDPNVAETMPAWGPDGRIAFVRSSLSNVSRSGLVITSSSDIYTIPETGGVAEPLAGASGGGLNYYPAYSPRKEGVSAGKWLAFTKHNNERTYGDPKAEIFLVPATGGDALRLAANNDANGNPTASNSWASWSLDGRYLAFNSRRTDPNFDIYVTEIRDDGSSTVATALPGASDPGVFEHTPFWGLPLQRVDVLQEWKGLLPWLIPLILLFILAWLLCRRSSAVQIQVTPPNVTPINGKIKPAPPAGALPIKIEHEVTPSLILGFGETGRWVLTHIKHTLNESSLGNPPEDVRLLVVDTGRSTDPKDRVIFAGTELAPDELLEITDSLEKFLRQDDIEERPAFRKWLKPAQLLGMGSDALDMRRGLKRQRVLARLGFLKHLQAEGNTDGFTNRLKRLIPLTLQEGRLNIVLVGDTSGDMGSALLFDAATIARKLGDELAEATTIQAHVITDREDQDRTAAINTAAFLREAKRFQLTEARPVNMYFGRDDLDGRVDQLLFDQVTLYDNQALVQNQRGLGAKVSTQVEPRYGVTVMVADSITLAMDKAMQATDLRDVVSNERNNTVNAQRETYDLMLASNGLYQYRLPMHYILQRLNLRFMDEMVRGLLEGDLVEDFAGLKDPSELARMFLTGQLGVKGTSVNDVQQVVFVVLNGGRQVNAAELEQAIGSIHPDEAKVKDELSARLRRTVGILLNGQENTPSDIARRGKIGLVLNFLSALPPYVESAKSAIVQTKKHDNLKTNVLAALDSMLKIADALKNALYAQLEILTGKDEMQKNALAYQIRTRLSQVSNRREDMDRLATRRYQWKVRGNELEEMWFQHAFNTYLSDALGLLYWEVGEKDITLTLTTSDSEVVRLSQHSAIPFMQALEHIVMLYCTTMGKPNSDQSAIQLSTMLADVLRDGLFSEDERNATFQQLTTALPLLAYEESRAGNPIPTDYMAVNVNVDSSYLRQQLLNPLTNTEQLLSVATTDPFSLSVQRRVAVVPLKSLQIENVWTAYNNEYGLDISASRVAPKQPILSSVYEAESVALGLEARFVNDLNTTPRQLNALIASALSESERVKAFCLAIAAGEVELRSVRGETAQQLWLLSDEVSNGEIQLKPVGTTKDARLHPLVWGVLTFALNERALPNQLFEQMFNRYRTSIGIQKIWEEWQNTGWQANLAPNDVLNQEPVEDLIRIARLWAQDFS